MSKPTDELTTEEAHESRQLQRPSPERVARFALIAVTIITSAVLGYLPILPMVAYGASLLGLAGIWVVGLMYLRSLKHASLKRQPAPVKENAEQTVLTETRPQTRSTVASSGLLHAMQSHPLASYFIIAYAITWSLSIPTTLGAWGLMPGDWTILFVVGTFGPFVASFVMTYITQGRKGVSRLQGSIKNWHVGGRWLLFAFAALPALIMLGIIILPGSLAGYQGLSPTVLVSYPVTLVAIWFGGGGLDEEAGWRGFALPRLQSRYGPLTAALYLGVAHCFWHGEQFLTPAQGGGPGTGLTPFLVNLPIFLVMVLAITVILNWLFNRTKGSVFTAISAHASIDAPQAALLAFFPAVGVTSMLVGATIGLGVAALLIMVYTHGRLGYQRAPTRIS